MIRIIAALAVVLTAGAGAWAQLIIRPPPQRPQPAGVIQPPSLPFTGAPGVPGAPIPNVRPRPQPFLVANPFFNQWGFAPYWPVYYDVPPPMAVPLVRTEVTVVAVPAAQPPVSTELKARLTLNIPANAQVWVGGQQIDAASIPVILESPTLEEGQSYMFNVRVVWKEARKDQDRQRTVTVEAGENKSLTYTSANGQ
jgi:uncharacterized protein (TIGR03000 family)